MGFALINFDRPDIAFAQATGAAQHRQQPARLGRLFVADRQGKPDAVLEIVASLFRAFRRRRIPQFLGRGLACQMLAQEGGGDLFGAMTR